MKRETEATAAGSTSAVGVPIGSVQFTITRKEHFDLVPGADGQTIGQMVDTLFVKLVENNQDAVVSGVRVELEDEQAFLIKNAIHLGRYYG